MKLSSIISGLPTSRVGVLNRHPEPYYLQITYEMALRCGANPWLVEFGTTNGAVSCVLAAALVELKGGHLTVVGRLPEVAATRIQEMGVSYDIVESLEAVKDLGKPALLSIGSPDLAAGGVVKALQLGARVIVLHDIHTSRKYKLLDYLPNREACDILEAAPDRDFHDLFRRVGTSKTDRGMAVSESRFWSGPPRLSLPQAINEPEVQVSVPTTATPIQQSPRWKGFGARES